MNLKINKAVEFHSNLAPKKLKSAKFKWNLKTNIKQNERGQNGYC